MKRFVFTMVFCLCALAMLWSDLDAHQQIIPLYKKVSQEIQALEDLIAEEIRADDRSFLAHFLLSEKERENIAKWHAEINQLRKTNKLDRAVVELPVLGAQEERALILNGRFEVYFSSGEGSFFRRYEWAPVFLEKKGNGWVFIDTTLYPMNKIPEVRVHTAEFEVEVLPEIESIGVRAKFLVTNQSSLPLSRLPVYFRYPLHLETASMGGKELEGEFAFAEIEGSPVAQLAVTLVPELTPGESAELLFSYSTSYEYHHLGRKPVGFSEGRGFVLWEAGWYPHFSSEWREIPYKMTIVVPAGLKGLTSGSLLAHQRRNKVELYTYQVKNPTAPYFVWGDYQQATHQLDTIELVAWTPTGEAIQGEPLLGLAAEALTTFQRILPTPDVMTFRLVAVTRYGGYGPLGNLLLQDRYFSLSETQKIETLEIIAHELSHSWIDSLSSPGGTLKAFLSEGLATYLGAKVVERCRAKADYLKIWENNQSRYQNTAYRAVAPTELSERVQHEDNVMFRAVAYQKGAYLFRELETLVGESPIFKALSEILLQHKGSFFTLENFLRRLDELTDKKLQPFWQWYLRSAELPDYLIVPAAAEAPVSRVKVRNLGDISPVPFAVVAYDKEMRILEKKELLLSTAESEPLEFATAESIAHIIVDPERRVLQLESRNDVYPDYLLPEEDVEKIVRLIQQLVRAVRQRDISTLSSLLTTNSQLLSPELREQILTALTAAPSLPLVQEGYVKVFNKGEGEAEAVAQLKVELPAASKLTIGHFRLVKEDDQWRAITFGIKLFGIKIE